MLFEMLDKVACGAESNALCNIIYFFICFQKKLDGTADPVLCQIIIEKHTGFSFEKIAEIRRAHLIFYTIFLDGQTFGIMCMDITNGVLNNRA